MAYEYHKKVKTFSFVSLQRRWKAVRRMEMGPRARRAFCKLFPFVLLITLVSILTVYNDSWVVTGLVDRSVSRLSFGFYASPEIKYDVILSSYMRSGSTIVGKLLGFRNDTFYFYEPLWKQHKWEYIKGQSQICAYVQKNCSDNIGDALEYNQKFINKMFDCDYLDYAENFDSTLHGTFSGTKWEQYHACIVDEELPERECLTRFTHLCREATHRFSKLLRMTVDNLIPILQQRPNLKVVHLWRDPRGIINSHWKSTWYPLYQKGIEPIKEDAEQLCKRMVYDLEVGKRMMTEFPERFRFIQYEEFANVSEKTRLLTEFLGMSFDDEEAKHVELLASSAKSQMAKITSKRIPKFSFNPSSWRTSLPWKFIQAIDELCADVYKGLGYKRFFSQDELENLNISAFADPLPYTLVK